MKYCKFCGAEIADEAVVCVKCGRAVAEQPITNAPVTERKQNKLGVAGFVLSLFTIQPLAFIFSIIGIIVGKKCNDKISLAVAGLIIGLIELVITIIIYSVYGPMLIEAFMEGFNEGLNGLAAVLPVL